MKKLITTLLAVVMIVSAIGASLAAVATSTPHTNAMQPTSITPRNYPNQVIIENRGLIRGHNNLLVEPHDRYVTDEVLVRFKPEARAEGEVVQEIAAAAHAKLGASVKEEFRGVPGLQLVKLPKGVTVPDAVAQYKQNPNVLYAEPNYLQYADAIPNNPDFKYQWGLQNTGQTIKGVTGTPGADIDAVDAWDKTTGSNDVIVASIDSGVDYRASDLAPNIVNGWDFVTNSNDPMDRDGHGTHVAGIIAAAGNSGIGVTGVMWKAEIMPLRVVGPNGAATNDIIKAIDYANSHGASIINMSLGTSAYSQAEKDAIDASPVLFVCSAGNSDSNNDQGPHYPSSYSSDNIIAVAATDQNDTLASFSDYGPNSVQVAAPGTNILSTFPPFIQLFNDQFNNFTAWDAQAPWHITPTGAMASIPSGSAVNASMTLKNPLDLTSKCGTAIDFKVKLDLVKNHSLFYIEASRDGIHWDAIAHGSGNSSGWIGSEVSLTNYDTSPYLYIRFGLTTDGSAGSNSVYFDNVMISAFDPSSTKNSYMFLDGTSMATPYVSGLSGLVKAIHRDYTSIQIKDAILKNVDVESSLRGKILTGGRINASKTLSGE
jgi:subtilisin family serine protease